MNSAPKILLVEDEAIIAMSLRMDLEDHGFEVCGEAASGEEAVQLARRYRPDIVIMDIHLAGAMNGVETACAIRETIPIHIIFITGYPSDTFQKPIADLEPLGCLTKPVSTFMIKPLLDQISG